MGYKAIRLQSGVPGLNSTYGVSKDKLFYEPADADLPTEKLWSTEKIPARRAGAVRGRAQGAGPDMHLLHDVHHRLTPIEAARLGKDLEPYRLFWLEDAVPAENQAELPPDPPAHDDAAGGRRGLQHHLGRQAADRGTADRLYPHHRGPRRRHHPSAAHRDPGRSLRCAHGLPWRDRSVAGLHGARRCTSTSRCPTSASRNICATPPRPTRSFPHAYSFKDGMLHPGETPGHGVDIDEALAAQFPYRPASPPT